MSESDTMFNKRDWRRAAVQLMLSNDPSYDNGTIASTLKMWKERLVQSPKWSLSTNYLFIYTVFIQNILKVTHWIQATIYKWNKMKNVRS